MADTTNAMSSQYVVALANECETAKDIVEAYKKSASDVISQVQGILDGLKADYHGEGTIEFYAACQSNINQITSTLNSVCEAYGGEQGLFQSIHNQILVSDGSLAKTLNSTNQRFKK